MLLPPEDGTILSVAAEAPFRTLLSAITGVINSRPDVVGAQFDL